MEIAEKLKELCNKTGIPFIINDDPEFALAVGADGLHIGQGDGDPLKIREFMGEELILGLSTHNMEEALKAEKAGADYIGFGAMFPTNSKDVSQIAGVEELVKIRPQINIPIVAIGGITRDNAGEVINAGADFTAVISSVMSDKTPGTAAAELSLLFNRKNMAPKGSVLTVAGSDSGGGAGLQADIKTVTLLGAYAASVVTALTSQNTLGVNRIHPVPPEFVASQLESVLSDIPVNVVKTGMLFSAEMMEIVADKLLKFNKPILVMDPVMIAKGGASLIDSSAVACMKEKLLPVTYLLTPNIPEAETLTGISITCRNDMKEAALKLRNMGSRNILLKGGHLPGIEAIDLFFDGKNFIFYNSPRIDTTNTHGTGCTLASAISANLALGYPLPDAIKKGKDFITEAIKFAVPLGKGHSPVNHYAASVKITKKL